MEIEELKQRWQEQDRKLEASLRLNTTLLNAAVLDKAATAMTRLSWFVVIELILSLAAAGWLGSFLVEHAAEARFFIPAAALGAGVIALIIGCARQLEIIWTVDYGEPIMEIQRKLGRLQVRRIRATQMVFLTAALVWTPLLIVALKGLLGLDAYAIFSSGWLAANVLFGVAVIPLAIWISRRYADRMKRSPLVQGLMRDMAGYNLNAAMGFLGKLEKFEQS